MTMLVSNKVTYLGKTQPNPYTTMQYPACGQLSKPFSTAPFCVCQKTLQDRQLAQHFNCSTNKAPIVYCLYDKCRTVNVLKEKSPMVCS